MTTTDNSRADALTNHPSEVEECREALRGEGFAPVLPELQDRHATVSDPVIPAELHHDTAKLVRRFARALANKLLAAQRKYGYSDNWMRDDWADECRTELMRHIQKGDPRDVAAYCAFLWHHNESTKPAQDANVLTDEQRADLLKLEAAATPMPWRYQENSDVYTHIVRSDANPGMIVAYGPQSSSGQVEADARFVAALRNAAPALLAASPVEQHEAAPAAEGESSLAFDYAHKLVATRLGATPPRKNAPSAPLEGTGNGADDELRGLLVECREQLDRLGQQGIRDRLTARIDALSRASSPNAAGAEDDANRGPCICQEDLGHPEGTCIWKNGRAPCAAPVQAAEPVAIPSGWMKLAESARSLRGLYHNTHCNPEGFRLAVESLADDAANLLRSPPPTAPASAPVGLTSEQLRKALSQAWNLGQTYWQQADSEYASQNRKSDGTRDKYLALVEETCAILGAKHE